MNTFKENTRLKPEPEVVEVKQSAGPTGKVARGFISVVNGGFLTKDVVVKQLPFVFYLVLIAMLYIANSYYAESSVREINQLTNELKELRSEYITTKSDLMHFSKQSQVAEAALKMGVRESRVPPRKINSNNQTN